MIEDKETVINTECKAEVKLWDSQHEGYFGVQDTLTLIDDIKVEMFNRGVKYANRWRKVSEELPNNGQLVLVKTIDNTYHTARYDANGGDFYSVSMYEFDDCELFLIDGIVEWKPID